MKGMDTAVSLRRNASTCSVVVAGRVATRLLSIMLYKAGVCLSE